jgi:hypothetical protein
MMNSNYNITSYADLEKEEIRVTKRIKKQEELIKLQLKSLPEEIITTGISKIVSGILNGDIFKFAFSVIKTVRSVFSDIKREQTKSDGLISLIKNIIKDKLSD